MIEIFLENNGLPLFCHSHKESRNFAQFGNLAVRSLGNIFVDQSVSYVGLNYATALV